MERDLGGKGVNEGVGKGIPQEISEKDVRETLVGMPGEGIFEDREVPKG